MTPSAFGEFLREHPRLGEQLRAIAAPAPRRGRLGFISDAVTLLFLLPLLRIILTEFGLPWRMERGAFDQEHWRRLQHWVEIDYVVHGIPSARALVVAGTIMRELERLEAPEMRGEWERLAEAMAGKGVPSSGA